MLIGMLARQRARRGASPKDIHVVDSLHKGGGISEMMLWPLLPPSNTRLSTRTIVKALAELRPRHGWSRGAGSHKHEDATAFRSPLAFVRREHGQHT